MSVVTPFFNPGAIFEETAASLFRQSFQQWEWIIADDGSDDAASRAALDRLVSTDSRVRVVSTGGRHGPAAARNLGAEQARAPYLAFVDSDDLLETTALEKWLWYLEAHPEKAMVKGYQVGFGAEEYLWNQGFHSGSAILDRNLLQPTFMIRRSAYLEAGGMDAAIRGGMEDWDFWLRCASLGHWGGTVPEYLDWYRRRPDRRGRWLDWDDGPRQAAFRAKLRQRHQRLYAGGFPDPATAADAAYAEIPPLPEFTNRLGRRPGVRRVLFLLPHFVFGGADKAALDVLRELTTRHNWEVTLASTRADPSPWMPEFARYSPDIFALDSFLRLCDYPRFLVYLIRSRAIDSVLISNSELGYRLLPYLRPACPGVRVCDYCHAEEPDWKAGGYPAMSVTYRDWIDATGTTSQHLKDWMTEHGGNASRIQVIPVSVDPGVWSRERYDLAALRTKWEVPAGVPVILFAGRLSVEKQPEVLAEAVRLLRERGLQFQCLVAGSGESASWMAEFVKHHRLSCLRLLGERTSDEVRELMAVSDIFLLPSLREGIALSLYEAMSMELAAVSARVGGQAELLTPECGTLITPGPAEPERYAEAVERLLRDPELRRQQGRAGRARVAAHFRLDKMGDAMSELLQGDPLVTPAVGAGTPFGASYAQVIIECTRLERGAEKLSNEREEGLAALDADAAQSHSDLLKLAAVMRPLFLGSRNSYNRRLLFRVLGNAQMRRRLRESFDGSFYCSSNPDVPPHPALALLHYTFVGYREGRRPAPGFDAAVAGASAGAREVNPLLWEIANGGS